MSIYSESVGTTYGELTVIALNGLRNGHHYVQVRCSCGTEKEVCLSGLRSAGIKTCRVKGKHPKYADRTMPAFNYIYDSAYKQRAIAKGLAFEISRELFRELTQQDCHYCGTPPSQESYRATSHRGTIQTGSEYSTYIYNGLDRVDSSLGYTVDNVVPCCGICNHAKHTMSYAAFTAWLDRVAAMRAKRELHCIEL